MGNWSKENKLKLVELYNKRYTAKKISEIMKKDLRSVWKEMVLISKSEKIKNKKIQGVKRVVKIEIDVNKLTDEQKYDFCRYIKDDRRVWSKIREDAVIYEYCQNVKDRKELWKRLKDEVWVVWYCRYVKDREELWKKLKSDAEIYEYCRHVKDRRELWMRLKEDEKIYEYCIYIKDRDELRGRITSKKWWKKYMDWVREEKG